MPPKVPVLVTDEDGERKIVIPRKKKCARKKKKVSQRSGRRARQQRKEDKVNDPSEYVEKREVGNGFGLFAKVDLKKGTLLPIYYTGNIVDRDTKGSHIIRMLKDRKKDRDKEIPYQLCVDAINEPRNATSRINASLCNVSMIRQ